MNGIVDWAIKEIVSEVVETVADVAVTAVQKSLEDKDEEKE